MILVVGGAWQGKGKVCRKLSGIEDRLYEARLADGRVDKPEMALKKPYIEAFHLFLRQVIAQGDDPEAYTKRVLAASPKVISMDEVGCGVVPMDRLDLEYREQAGQCGQILAAEAEQVYRVVCGIPSRIKPS